MSFMYQRIKTFCRIVVQWIKLPLATRALHIRVPFQVHPALLSIQLPANVPEKTTEDGPDTWVPVS